MEIDLKFSDVGFGLFMHFLSKIEKYPKLDLGSHISSTPKGAQGCYFGRLQVVMEINYVTYACKGHLLQPWYPEGLWSYLWECVDVSYGNCFGVLRACTIFWFRHAFPFREWKCHKLDSCIQFIFNPSIDGVNDYGSYYWHICWLFLLFLFFISDFLGILDTMMLLLALHYIDSQCWEII